MAEFFNDPLKVNKKRLWSFLGNEIPKYKFNLKYLKWTFFLIQCTPIIQDGHSLNGDNVWKFANSYFLELLFDNTTYLRKSKIFRNTLLACILQNTFHFKCDFLKMDNFRSSLGQIVLGKLGSKNIWLKFSRNIPC